MRKLAVALFALAVGCGDSAKPPAPAPKPPPAAPMAPKAPEVKSDPTGKNLCLTCGIKTNEDACPKCKAVLKAAPAPAAAKSSGEVGKSQVGALWACPKEGCAYTEAKKNTCLKHGDTQLQEQWFVCEKDSVKEPVAGKCSKCGAALSRKLF
jgi:hypothetical protein